MAIKEMKEKVIGKVSEVKDWTVDHKVELIAVGVYAGIITGGVLLGRRSVKKGEVAWQKAMEAYKNGQMDYDFGPYKIMRILEPKTGDFIGEVLCHKDVCKALLGIK